MSFTPVGLPRARVEPVGLPGIAAVRGQDPARGLSGCYLAGTLVLGSVLAFGVSALAQASQAVTAEAVGAELPDAPLPATAPADSDAAGPIVTDTPQPGSQPRLAVSGGLEWASLRSETTPDAGFEVEFGTTSVVPMQPVSGRTYVALEDCPYDRTHALECRMHWKPMLLSSAIFNAFQNSGNLYTGYWYRWETTHGRWWDRYIASAAGWRWDRWSDNNPFLDDYVGHPIMGAITNSIWIQNDPKGMTLTPGNNWPYWHSRLRAAAWTTFYSFEWKLGPLGEAGIGHNGDHYFVDKNTLTNETGWVELVTTPVGGFAWTLAEDYLDQYVVRSLEDKSRNPLLLTAYQFLTPARGFANILRFRPPWYRDSRVVKAQTFWSDPGNGISAGEQQAIKFARRRGNTVAAAGVTHAQPAGQAAAGWEGPGGRHEFGAWWGLSLISGHIWGYAGDVKYMPIDVRYSYEFARHKEAWAFRYSPEVTALAMIDWLQPDPATNTVTSQSPRVRAYGGGVSPVGFRWGFLPLDRVQPFLSMNAGFLYFDQPVLSTQGSQFMYTVDYGAGFNIFRHGNQAITIGYRYQHLSNANISIHNPGTDANTFYVGVSRFRNKAATSH